MRIAIMQPYFFPYIGYFQLINAVDKFIIYDDVNYINKGWVNRNRILVQGKPYLFTLPLSKASQNLKINEIELGDRQKWSLKFLKTLSNAYKKAPKFSDTFPLVEEVILIDEPNLATYLTQGLQHLCNYLNIDTPIKRASLEYDNQTIKGEERIIDICKREQATEYINAVGGKELYARAKFRDEGINLYFLQMEETEYIQNNTTIFIPYLSIIDVMMYNSESEVKKMLSNFILEK